MPPAATGPSSSSALDAAVSWSCHRRDRWLREATGSQNVGASRQVSPSLWASATRNMYRHGDGIGEPLAEERHFHRLEPVVEAKNRRCLWWWMLAGRERVGNDLWL